MTEATPGRRRGLRGLLRGSRRVERRGLPELEDGNIAAAGNAEKDRLVLAFFKEIRFDALAQGTGVLANDVVVDGIVAFGAA